MKRLLLAGFVLSAVGAGHRVSADQSVSLALDRASLTRVCAELTRQTGVKHEVTAEGKGQRVVLFCRDQPAGAVRRSLTSLLGWTWKRSGEGDSVRFALSKPWQLRKRENELREESFRRYAEVLKTLESLAQDPTMNLKGVREDSPLRFHASQPNTGAFVRSLSALPPEVAEKVRRGVPFEGRQGALPSRFAAAIENVVQTDPVERFVAGDSLRLAVIKSPSGRPEHLQLAFYREGKLRRYLQTAPNQGETAEASDPHSSEFGNSPQLPNGFDRVLPKLTPLQWPEPPSPEPSYIGWVLRDLSRRIPEPILADCYPEAEMEQAITPLSRPPWASPQSDGKRLGSVLTALKHDRGYNSRVENGWLLLRYREAYWEANRPQATKRPSAPAP